MRIIQQVIISILMMFCFTLMACVSAQQIDGVDETAQLPFYEWRNDVMSLRLVQRLPDQTRAYFAGRGFNKTDTDYIAQHCIFQSIYSNISQARDNMVIEYDVSKWRILYQGRQLPLKLREDWQQQWRIRKARTAQKIAFNWSLLPTRQSIQAADYNWGMTVYPLPHGAVFDLHIHWKENKVAKSAHIKNLSCAKDVYIAPQQEP